MIFNRSILLYCLVILFTTACTNDKPVETTSPTVNVEQEKAAILSTLHNETKMAFQRDYPGWKNYWVHDPSVTKTYLNFADTTFSESVGWKEIDDFVRTYIEDHPEPEPVPELVADIDVRLYGKGAWVTYEQRDSVRGLKREVRLMEKVDGMWKIAGMQTSIYGFTND